MIDLILRDQHQQHTYPLSWRAGLSSKDSVSLTTSYILAGISIKLAQQILRAAASLASK